MRNRKVLLPLLVIIAILTSCVHLLPGGKDTTKSRWKTFQDAKADFDRVVPNRTTAKQLRAYGFDLYSTPNIRVLNYIDIAAATQAIRAEKLDPGLRRCLDAKTNCQAYEFSPQEIHSQRYGNFWADLFNFSRKIKDKGWRFKALFVVVNGVVVEKFWSGVPNVDTDREATNPLGPFQDSGSMIMRLIP